MDKKVMFAVAGSGKTTYILNQLNLEQRALIITYTNNNLSSIRSRIIQKWNYIPRNIKVDSYFSFLYSFCYKPFLLLKIRAKGMNWTPNPNYFATNIDRYLDRNSLLYSNRLAKLLDEKEVIPDIINRIERYFDVFLVDEVQDFAGHDFNFLASISAAKVKKTFVGDFFQHTFDTSRDGKVNSTLHDDFDKYKARYKKMGLDIDGVTLVKSHRCSKSICQFISKNIGIKIDSHREDSTSVELIEDSDRIAELLRDDKVVKLFYQEHYRYNCYSRNWGESKGEDKYRDVCVVLNKRTMKAFKAGTLSELSPSTRNKFYVACSRANGNL